MQWTIKEIFPRTNRLGTKVLFEREDGVKCAIKNVSYLKSTDPVETYLMPPLDEVPKWAVELPGLYIGTYDPPKVKFEPEDFEMCMFEDRYKDFI